MKIQRQQNKRNHECHIFPNVFKSRSAKNLEVPVEENDVKRFDDEEEVENIVKSRKIVGLLLVIMIISRSVK